MRLSTVSSLAFAFACVAGAALAACTKAAEPATPPPDPTFAAPPAPEMPPLLTPPLQTQADAFPDCTWAETRGAGLSLVAFKCPASEIVARPELPGLMRIYKGENAPQPVIVVQLFAIPDGAPIESIDAAVRDASPAKDVALCGLQPSESSPGWHEFKPTGALKESYAKFLAGTADEPALPCGSLGPSEAGGRYFKLLPGSTTQVAMVDLPSDIPDFDVDSLKAAE